MKTIGVVIVIITMLGFTQADHYNPSYVQVEPNNCSAKCLTKSIVAANDCMTSCGLVKSINVNNDVRDRTTYVVNSCMQECLNKK
ncbi:hypothetical protein GLYMA_03G085400v4 [Glycine max]|uniref:Thionin-like protein n=1 Tax=Glycine max TaxID=3847 RepID=K7KDU4_SOYBN|nr:hypothetical protein GYH30_006640 [Glycine max]KRH66135.1 hypothetical protein GLYMA_03G085400v4 [Glycine max]